MWILWLVMIFRLLVRTAACTRQTPMANGQMRSNCIQNSMNCCLCIDAPTWWNDLKSNGEVTKCPMQLKMFRLGTHLVVRHSSKVEPTKITELEKWNWIPIDVLCVSSLWPDLCFNLVDSFWHLVHTHTATLWISLTTKDMWTTSYSARRCIFCFVHWDSSHSL